MYLTKMVKWFYHLAPEDMNIIGISSGGTHLKTITTQKGARTIEKGTNTQTLITSIHRRYGPGFIYGDINECG